MTWQVYSPDQVWALVRAAESEADAALFLTAAFTGLQMGELLALRWCDVDFAGSSVRVRESYDAGNLSTPKSVKVRAVPLAPDAAGALAQQEYTGARCGSDARARKAVSHDGDCSSEVHACCAQRLALMLLMAGARTLPDAADDRSAATSITGFDLSGAALRRACRLTAVASPRPLA